MPLPKQKGDVAELRAAFDLRERGCRISIPFGEEADYDLVIERDGKLERVQVKYTESNGEVVEVKCRSHSLTNGRIRRTKHYTAETIDWLAVYDRTTDRCYYVPASELADGRSLLHLRLTPTRNGQRAGIRFAEHYLGLDQHLQQELDRMEPAGLEPAPSALQTPRSSN
jgi:hypothetical protein